MALHELRTRKRADGARDLGLVAAYEMKEVGERGGRLTAREAEEGSKDGDLGAHGCHYVQH